MTEQITKGADRMTSPKSRGVPESILMRAVRMPYYARFMSGTIRSFSLNNPHGPTVEDLPLLLRRLANAIEEEGISADELLDVVLSNDELIEEGFFCWRATVYWSPNQAD